MFQGYGLVKISGSYFSEHIDSLMKFIQNNQKNKLILMVGGGNIVRGRDSDNSKRLLKDRMGILSTLINAIDLSDKISNLDIKTYITSPICNEDIINPYNPLKIKSMMKKNDIQIIICGGLGWCGNVSTDTAMVIRGLELSCSWVCKASVVGGVFDSDPNSNINAKLITNLYYEEAIKYDAYDKSAIFIAKENKLPMLMSNLDNLTYIIRTNKAENCTLIK